jgi:hypothetical protein
VPKVAHDAGILRAGGRGRRVVSSLAEINVAAGRLMLNCC